MSALDHFREAITAAGIEAPDVLHDDGKIHRFSPSGRGSDKAAWYMLHTDGVPAGAFGDWRTGITSTWCAKSDKAMTPAELAAHRQRVKAMQAQREADQLTTQLQASQTALQRLENSAPCTQHNYLSAKGVKGYGVMVGADGFLIVPMRDTAGKLHSLQTITPDGEKRFHPGGRVKACYHAIGKPAGRVIVCEGYATGASIHEATGDAVAVAFNAGNLETVALALRSKYPELRLIVAADDDYLTEGNPGMTKAKNAALAVGGFVAVPEFDTDRPERATDFNDLHQTAGLDAVRRGIEGAVQLGNDQTEPSPPKSPKPRKASLKRDIPSDGPPDLRPQIELKAGMLDRIVNDMEAKLSLAGGYYNRGGLITSVVEDAITPACIQPLSAPALARALSRNINFVRFDNRTVSLKSIDPAPKYVNALFDAESYPHLPPLKGIARQPHFRRDGTLCMMAGYDAATGLFGAFNPADFSVKDAPSRQDAQHALDEISSLLTGFDFQDDNARAAALAAILTAAIRPTLATAPMFHAAAHQISSGKSYLLKIIAGFAGAENPAMLSMPPNDEEFRKLLLATLLEAPPVVVFDNLSHDIQPFGSFCTALTEPTIQGRVLGASKNATVSTRSVFLSSGNNVGPVRDMARRVITIRLDPKIENPALRQFTDSPAATLERRRGEFVSHALTIIRAYAVAGRPRTSCPGFGSYDEWAALVRQPLLWLGIADPVANIVEQLAADPDREELGRLLTAWQKVFGATAAHVADAVEKTQPGVYGSSTELHDVCMELAEERGQINRRRLGKWIARHAGRIVGGLRFEKSTSKSYSQKWQVVELSAPDESQNSRLVGLSRSVLPLAEKLAEISPSPSIGDISASFYSGQSCETKPTANETADEEVFL